MDKQSGYIAITSILIITLLLMSVLLSLGLISFFQTEHQANMEIKTQSSLAAAACVNFARTKVKADANYSTSNLSIYLGPIGECSVVSVLPVNGFPKIITAQGRYPPGQTTQAYTNLSVAVGSSGEIISWQEVVNN